MRTSRAQYRQAIRSTSPASVARRAGASVGESLRPWLNRSGGRRRDHHATALHVLGQRLRARLEYAAMDIVARHADAHPDKAAVIDGDERRHLARVPRGAQSSRSRARPTSGSRPGSTWCSTPTTRSRCCWPRPPRARSGLIPVPMNHRLTAEEVAYILDDSDAVAVFASDAFVPMLERVRARGAASASRGAAGRRAARVGVARE